MMFRDVITVSCNNYTKHNYKYACSQSEGFLMLKNWAVNNQCALNCNCLGASLASSTAAHDETVTVVYS